MAKPDIPYGDTQMTIDQAVQPTGEFDHLTKQVPEIYTARYLAKNVMLSGQVVPVGISMEPPLYGQEALGYEIKHSVKALMPEPWMWKRSSGWGWTSWKYRDKLDNIGPERIVQQLAAISDHNDNKPLALLCYEDLEKPNRCHRLAFSFWFMLQTGIVVHELTDDGQKIHPYDFQRQNHPALIRAEPKW